MERAGEASCSLSTLCLGVCWSHPHSRWHPPILFQQAFTSGKGVLTVPRTERTWSNFPESLIPVKCQRRN